MFKNINSFIVLIFVLNIYSSCSQNIDTKETKNMKEFNYTKSDKEWKKQLSDQEYRILIQKGTEYPNTGKYNLHFEEGIYNCNGCKTKLFKSDQKFESDCGWPSFDDAIDGAVLYENDYSLGMKRVEILCANCGGHLGHIFNDGPTSTGNRYCVNSASIDFKN